MKTIVAKPHHILDIIKLYGAGLEHFVPDPAYGHDFYRIGNDVLAHPETTLKFVVEGDDICTPCKYYKDGKCIDSVDTNPAHLRSKDLWNKTIDKRLMELFDIKENDTMTVVSYAKHARERLNADVIGQVWHERPAEETRRRTELLLAGLDKYIQAKSNE